MDFRLLPALTMVLPVILWTDAALAAGPDRPAARSDLMISVATLQDEEKALPFEEDVETADDEDWLDREAFTGDWWGVRSDLAETGISIDPYIIFDFSQNTRGGLDTNHSRVRHLFSFNMTFDLATMLNWNSGTVFIDFQNQNGPLGSESVGDYQSVGSYDADGFTQISEFWFEFEWFDGTIRTKAGKVDANDEFARTELGEDFVHGSASYPIAYFPLVSMYPDQATSVNIFYYPDDHWSFGFGVYDGAAAEGYRTGSRGPSTFFGSPSDMFLIGEIGYLWYLADESLPGRVAVGGFYHTGTFEEWDGSEQDDTAGFHVVLDQMFWREDPSDEKAEDFHDQGVGAFFQFDYVDEDILDVQFHIGGGLTWRGMLPNRDDDLAGVLVSYIDFTDEVDAEYVDDAETAVELMYKAYVTPAVTFQPYVQYISNPGGEGLDDAINIGFRSEIGF